MEALQILVRDPVPEEFEAALEQRRRVGNDRHDEVWAGVYHVNPAPTFAHALMCKRLLLVLDPIAAAAGSRSCRSTRATACKRS